MFTSGKSTIANNIIRDNDNVFVIPQATIRKRREDDNENFFRFFDSKSEFQNQKFFSCYGDYGILEEDIVQFFSSSSRIAVAVVSTLDVIDFIKKVPRNNLMLILKTLSLTLEEEVYLMYQRFPVFFKGDNLKKRIMLGCDLARKYYFNSDYNNIFDLIIPLNNNVENIIMNNILISTAPNYEYCREEKKSNGKMLRRSRII